MSTSSRHRWYWAPAACSEFADALHDARHNMKYVVSLFAPAPGGDDAACTPAELARVLAVVGCRFTRPGAAEADAGDDAKRAALQ